MTTAIEIADLSFSYGKSKVLEQVNLSFRRNTFSVLLGRNGSGKSTLFNLVVGLLKPQSGRITILGEDINMLSDRERARRVGFLSQFHTAVFPFVSRDVILTGRAAFSSFNPSRKDYEKVEKAADELGISDLLDRPYTELSGGEQQLVMIARLLVQNPAVIVLDEPTNHLDVYYQTYLLKKLKSLASQGLTVIAIMHDPGSAFLHADELLFMKDKTVIKHNPSTPIADFLYDIYQIPFESVVLKGKQLVIPSV